MRGGFDECFSGSGYREAGSALRKLRQLTDEYTSSDWACNTYRAMIEALVYLGHDMHQHVHKENNVIFPRALDVESNRKG